MEGTHGCASRTVIGHGDKSKPARATLAVKDDAHFEDFAVFGKGLPQGCLLGFPGKAANE